MTGLPRFPLHRRQRCLLVGAALAVWLLASAEAGVVLVLGTNVGLTELPLLWLGIVGAVPRILTAPLLWLLVLVVIVGVQGKTARARALQRALSVVATLAFALYAYAVLIGYEGFRGYLPFAAAFVAFAVLLSGLVLLLGSTPSSRYGRLLRPWLGPSVVSASALAHAGNFFLYRGQYPTLHASALLVTFALLVVGLAYAVERAGEHPRGTRADGFVALSTALLLVASGLGALGAYARIEPALLHYSMLGQCFVVFRDVDDGRLAGAAGDPPPATDPEAAARFREHSGLPPLPSGFRLDDYNLLLVVTDTLRFDKTSLHDAGLRTTPFLREWSEGALNAVRAYSPSSGTLPSMSSVLTAKPTSMIALETWSRPWWGELRASETTVTEVLRGAGYDTFWVGHDHNRAFKRAIHGFEQGFDEIARFYEPNKGRVLDVDEKIRVRAVAELKERAGREQRFFGLVFFVSPHGPYQARYDDLPKGNGAARYLHEVRNVDEQFQALMKGLEESGHLEDTVVIFMSDHGEEFKEHGGSRHKSTVYVESTHVPLLIRVPAMPAGTLREPTSTGYVLPWLFSSAADDGVRAFAEERLVQYVGPLMRETAGGVLIELIGHDRMRSSLVYPRHKLNYDFFSQLYELYDLAADPLEQRNLFDDDDPLSQRYRARFERYRALRQQKQQYILLKDKKHR